MSFDFIILESTAPCLNIALQTPDKDNYPYSAEKYDETEYHEFIFRYIFFFFQLSYAIFTVDLFDMHGDLPIADTIPSRIIPTDWFEKMT